MARVGGTQGSGEEFPLEGVSSWARWLTTVCSLVLPKPGLRRILRDRLDGDLVQHTPSLG